VRGAASFTHQMRAKYAQGMGSKIMRPYSFQVYIEVNFMPFNANRDRFSPCPSQEKCD
jgi:hypothetical protein